MPIRALEKGIPLRELAAHVGGALEGNADLRVRVLCASEDIVPGGVTFIRDPRSREAREMLPTLRDAALLVPSSWKDRPAPPSGCGFIVTPDPLAAMVALIPLFFEERAPSDEVSPKADIHPSARLGRGVKVGAFASIGPGCVIGDGSTIYPRAVLYPGVTLGKECQIHAGATIREECTLGDRVIVHCGAVIGADGFGFYPDPKVGLRKVPQVGTVAIGSDVEIGANACIDRATFGVTSIGSGTKIDNLVQIGHNVRIGTHTILCGQVAVGGSVRIGNQVVLGGQSGVADHVRIEDGVRVAGGGGVTHDLERGDFGGYPAVSVVQWRRQRVAMEKLPGLLRKLKQSEKGDE